MTKHHYQVRPIGLARPNRRAFRQKTGTHTATCVVCSKPIPRKHVAMWVTDKWNGTIYGCHMGCAEDTRNVMDGMKAAMTTPEWIRFRFRQIMLGQKRTWARFASRWTDSKKMVG